MSTPDVQADQASGGQGPLGDGSSVPGDVQPQPGQQAPPPAGPPLESTAQILATGNPQQFYADGQRFDQIAGRLRGLSDGFRSELRRVEQSWRGPGAELFQDAAQKITQSIERLIDTISAPAYSSVMNQLGDALAEAQRQVNDVQTQRQQGRDALAANPAAAGDPAAQANQQQQETAQGEHANQVLQQLALTYQNLGSQLRVLPSRNSSGTAANDGGGGGASARSAGTMSAGGPATMDSSGTAGTMMAPMSVGTTTRMSGDGSVLGRESAGTWGAPSADDSVVENAGLTDSGVLAPQSGSAAPMLGAFGATGGFLGAASQAKRRSTSASSGASGGAESGEMTTFGMPASIGGGERGTTASLGGERGSRPSTESIFEQRRQNWAETLGQPGTDGSETGEPGRTAEATASFGAGEAAVPGLPPGTTGGPAVPPGAPAPGFEGTHPAAHVPATGSASGGSAAAGAAGGPSAKLPSLPNVTGGLPATSGLSASPSLPGSTSLPGVETAGASVPNGASSAVPRGVPGAGMPGAVPGAAGSGMGAPMMPPMAGMGAGMGGALGSRGNQDRDRNTLQQEDEDVWDTTDGLSGGVLGRD